LHLKSLVLKAPEQTPLLSLLCALCACAPMQSVKTEIRVRDPSQFALRAPDGTAGLPAGSSVTEVPIAAGRAQTGMDSSAAYDVRARREQDGSIAVVWATTVPLRGGDRYTV
jgi:hypothetical protein